MLKQTLFLVLFIFIFSTSAQSEIIQIQKIEDISSTIDSPHTLVLFDMDDTLTDSTISLGSGAWRKYIRKKIEDYEKQYGSKCSDEDLHDLLTFYVANRVPVKPVEELLPQVVADLQTKGIPVFVFTARGKSKWYSTDLEGIQNLTTRQLETAGYHFELSKLPPKLQAIDPKTYENGVIYSSPLKKGLFLKNLLKKTDYQPSKIIFIDDKLDQVQSMEEAALGLKIPFVGFWYTRADKEHQNFDSMIATIQLIELMNHERILDDAEALSIKKQIGNIDADMFFYYFLDQLCTHKIK